MDNYAYLYVISGEPYSPGTCVNLTDDTMLIGRVAHQSAPDLAFTNAYISRQHVIIRRERDKALLYDLGSRHGTELNGVRMTPHKPYLLHNFDRIQLSKGLVVLHFSYSFAEQTLDIEAPRADAQPDEAEARLIIHWDKRECIVEGKRIPMSEKEYLFLRALHEHPNQLVPLNEIKASVWPERLQGEEGIPDVTLDELNALVYRVRKKYGKDTLLINAVRGSGYILETESKTRVGITS
ncbi:FHA domain-containing protein [Paenibacillus sp. GCM10023250]|uniref:FHA domain-containing protein n=1 Tax=Paenibacillus sp. GCM10023250 TaxID=3252648 RepID=UPI00361B5388